MGVLQDGQESPIPQFENWFEYAVAVFCITQFVGIAYHVVLLFRSKARNKLSYMFRGLFVVGLLCTTTQSIHYFTPGHPFIHWLGVTTFSLILAILVICEMQILKTFTIMTTFITDGKINIAQRVYFAWLLVYLVQSCLILPYLGTTPTDSLLELIANLHYQVYVSCGVLYETWNTIFLSYLIVRYRSRSDAHISSPGDTRRVYFHSKNTSLIVYLGFMLSFLWFSIGVWLVAYTLPVQTAPWQTSVRIIGNHLGMWYLILIYYFFESLKKVQLKLKDADNHRLKKPLLLVQIKSITEALAKEPTLVFESTVR
jgi:hypothetical protein